MLLITPVIARMASTASRVECWIAPTWLAISSVAHEVWLASALTSAATTAKPLPASPARAASIVAFSANRLVCAAIFEISPASRADTLRGLVERAHGLVGALGVGDGRAGHLHAARGMEM